MRSQQYIQEKKDPQLTHIGLKEVCCRKVGKYSRCSAFQDVSRIPGRQRRRPWLFRARHTALALAPLCKDLRASLGIFLPMFFTKKSHNLAIKSKFKSQISSHQDCPVF